MSCIIIQGKELKFDKILSGSFRTQDPYIRKALDFCKEWLTGQQEFRLQTSGSTGKPKELLVTREQMAASAKATGEFFSVPAGSNLLCCLNVEMIGGKMMLVRAMEWNCRLYLEKPATNPLENLQVDFYFAAMVPMQLEACLGDAETFPKLLRIENLIIGGAPMNEQLRNSAAALPINIYQTFGMTETVSHVALAKLTPGQPPVYQALPGVKFSQTEDRKLVISSPTARPEILQTNDIVELIADFSFIWKGRADFTINSGGVKIQPEEIENQILPVLNRNFPGKRYFIFGRQDEKLGQKVCLLIENGIAGKNQASDLLREIKALVSKYAGPKAIYFLEEFEVTASGKINRRATIDKLLSL
jgi:o-succinylbenzoate---CoA ligase